MPPEKVLLIFNPMAGRQEMRLNLFEVLDLLTKNGYEVTVHPTQSRRDAYRQTLERGAGYPYLFCSGGDGTLSEVLDALMQMERPPLLGYIPSGTTNDFAGSLGLPKDVLKAAETLCGGEIRMLDVGKFGDRFFSYVAAFGLFTDVPYDTPQDMKNVLGHAAYLLEGAKRLASIQSYPCTIALDGEKLKGDFIFGMVSNSTSIAGFKMPTGAETRLDDGLFEVILLKRPRSFVDLQNVIASLINRELYTNSLLIRRAAHIAIETKIPIRWTLDGEDGGTFTGVAIQNCPRALRILAPKTEAD